MTRDEFMRELERLLGDVTVEEREEALKYYEGYFDDAGLENEDVVIKELGSPRRIASMIKKDLQDGGRSGYEGEYTERGYQNGTEYRYEMSSNGKAYGREGGGLNSDTVKIALVVLVCILFSPLLVGVFSVIVGLVGTFFGLFVACAAIALAFSVSGIVVTVVGFWNLIYAFPLGVLLVGIGLMLMGFGILLIILNAWVWGNLLPTLVRWTVKQVKTLTKKKEARS